MGRAPTFGGYGVGSCESSSGIGTGARSCKCEVCQNHFAQAVGDQKLRLGENHGTEG